MYPAIGVLVIWTEGRLPHVANVIQASQLRRVYRARPAQKSHCALRYAESVVTIVSIVTSVSLSGVMEGQATLPVVSLGSPKVAKPAQ